MNISLNIRGMLLALCIAFCAVLFCLGWIAWRSDHELNTIISDFYDNGFNGVGYARDAQADFLRFAADHPNANTAPLDATARGELGKLIDDLDRATARALSEETRASATRVRAEFAALLDVSSTRPKLDQIDAALQQMVKQFADDT